MLKKTITYTDYNGNERTEDFYFNLSKAELIQLDMGAKGGGGFVEYLRYLIATNDNAGLEKMIRQIILKSYGIKSPDGKKFMKSEEISHDFECSAAYDSVFMELFDADKSAEFFRGVIPADLAKQIDTNVPDDLENLSGYDTSSVLAALDKTKGS